MLTSVACAQLRHVVHPEPDRCARLQGLHARVASGDFEGAIRESQEALANPSESRPADLALFNLGLLYAHYANPKKDYKKSLAYFTRLVKDFPRSPLVEEAKIWVDVLEAMERAQWVDIEIEEMKKGMSK